MTMFYALMSIDSFHLFPLYYFSDLSFLRLALHTGRVAELLEVLTWFFYYVALVLASLNAYLRFSLYFYVLVFTGLARLLQTLVDEWYLSL